MGLMDSLMSGAGKEQLDDFIGRYDKGAPWDGIGDDEARERHDQVAGHLSEDEYRESARASLERLSPDQRRELGQQLKREARGRDVAPRELDEADDDKLADSGFLAQALSGLNARGGPGMVGQLLGGGSGGGGMLANPVAKAALSGIAAMAMKRLR